MVIGVDTMECGLQTITASVLGSFLLLIGILGFLDAPLFGVFEMGNAITGIHIISGALFVTFGVWGGLVLSRKMNRVLGGAYLFLAILGLMKTLVPLSTNLPAVLLHAGIGLFALGVGLLKKP